MADAKIYVQVNKFAVKDIFDAKYKAKAITAMQKAAENAIKGKLTTDTPKDKGAKGWSLDGSLVSLAPGQGGQEARGQGVDVDLDLAGQVDQGDAVGHRGAVDPQRRQDRCRRRRGGGRGRRRVGDEVGDQVHGVDRALRAGGVAPQSHFALRKRHQTKAQAPAMIASAAG